MMPTHDKEHRGTALPQGLQVGLVVESTPLKQPSPVAITPSDQRRASLASRLSDPRSGNASGNVSSEERVPARDRLSVNTLRTSRSERTPSESPVFQARVAHATDLSPLPMATNAITRPSSSNIFETGRLGPCERSPIRTLSKDRVHVSLRLGPIGTESEENEEDSAFDLQLQQALSSKAAGKRVAGSSQIRRGSQDSPSQGVIVKRRRVSKSHPSPRRKLMMDAIAAGGRTSAATGGKAQGRKKQKPMPSTKIIPPMVRKGKDFRPPKESLP